MVSILVCARVPSTRGMLFLCPRTWSSPSRGVGTQYGYDDSSSMVSVCVPAAELQLLLLYAAAELCWVLCVLAWPGRATTSNIKRLQPNNLKCTWSEKCLSTCFETTNDGLWGPTQRRTFFSDVPPVRFSSDSLICIRLVEKLITKQAF